MLGAVAASILLLGIKVTFAAETCGPDPYSVCDLENPCCSVFGFCGASADFCGTGCKATYSYMQDCSVPPEPNVVVVTQCMDPASVAITFDDGPFQFTDAIAKAFSDAGGHVTFFVNGMNYDCIYNYADTIISAHVAGHQIASHTWDHKDLQTLTNVEIDLEMQQLHTALRKILGMSPTYMRPPFGSYNRDVLFSLAANNITHVIMWDADSGDSAAATFEEEVATYNGLGNKDGHVILNHDPLMQTAQELVPFIIQWAADKGLKMVTVGECLGQAPSTWYYDVTEPETRNPTWKCGANDAEKRLRGPSAAKPMRAHSMKRASPVSAK